MSDTDTDYFEITGGEAEKLLAEWFAACDKIRKARSAFLRKWKVKTYYGNDRNHGIYAMIFGTLPDQAVWRRSRSANGNWVPRKTTPEGKALYQEMLSFNEPCFERVVEKIIGYGDVFIGTRRHFPGLQYLGKTPVISIATIPAAGDSIRGSIFGETALKLVTGVKKLKASEYWRRKEREKPAKAKKSA